MHISKINTSIDFYTNGAVKFIKNTNSLPEYVSKTDHAYLNQQLKLEKTIIPFYFASGTSYLIALKGDEKLEPFRKKGNELFSLISSNKNDELLVDGSEISVDEAIAFMEGLALSAYQFIQYFAKDEQEKKKIQLSKIQLYHKQDAAKQVQEIEHIVNSVFWSRNMVNEPLNSLNAKQFSEQISETGSAAGLKVEVFDKKKIESLKMGGLLAVNKGSIDPPTFTIIEHKPANAVNSKPYVLVGKGVMYDTGGLSLKPTPGSMDSMKSDMGGAAGVAGAMFSIGLNKLPVWVIALIPATDNRPDGNAYTPGDIIKMYNGLHVEVLNTDAEGRLIMADALSYGDKFDPELVIDMATLTGSAVMAIGKEASICMGNADEKHFEILQKAGETAHERVVQFPFWDDYNESLKSPIADLKNLGNREAGAITAGKFLEHFTKAPYIHIDIAGTAFLSANDSYRLKGGTGVGVRLLTEFFKIVSKPL